MKAALTPAIRIHAPLGDRQELDWALAHRLETEAEQLASLPFEAGLARLARMLGLPLEANATEPAEDRKAGPRSGPATDFTPSLSPDPAGRACRIVARPAATGPPGWVPP